MTHYFQAHPKADDFCALCFTQRRYHPVYSAAKGTKRDRMQMNRAIALNEEKPTASAQDAGQTLTSYPPKPEGATHFQRNYGYEPATVIRWEWSTAFGRWCALVKFEDGSEWFTWPKPYPHTQPAPVGWDTVGALAEDEQPAQPASAPQAHTAGPWEIWGNDGEIDLAVGPVAGGVAIAQIVTVNGIGVMNAETSATGAANAKLIASAPELFAALTGLVEPIIGAGSINIVAARAAIARATQPAR